MLCYDGFGNFFILEDFKIEMVFVQVFEDEVNKGKKKQLNCFNKIKQGIWYVYVNLK